MKTFRQFIIEELENNPKHLHDLINRLYDHYKFNDEDTQEIKDYTKRKTSHDFSKLTSSFTTPEDMYVYRGANDSSLNAFDEKKVKSSSVTFDNAAAFGKHIWKIHVPKGSHGAFIAPASAYDSEHEFIFHPKAKIVPTGKISNHTHGGKNYIVRHAVLDSSNKE